jgi:xylulokinase
MSIYLGIDIGTSSTKVVAINAGGHILAQAGKAYPCSHPKVLWSEQDPDDWWNATVESMRSVVSSLGSEDAHDVEAIGLSGQMHGAVFLDQKQQVIRPAILWNDQRSSFECSFIESLAGGRARLVEMVANPALTGFTAPKILWLRTHEPEHFERVRKVLLPKDEIRRRLTGEYATDVNDASGTLLFDVAKRSWSGELMGKLDLSRDLMPPALESIEVTGTLTSEAARILGLTTRVKVIAGAGDCAAGGIGNGVVKPGVLSTSIGTSGIMFAHADDMKVDPSGRLHTFCHAVPGKWHIMGVNLTGGGCMEWFAREIFGATSDDAYRQLMEEALKVRPGSDGLFFLPYLSGERTPLNDPSARACFIGLTLSHTRAHMTRSIMEGVAYNLKFSLDIMRSLDLPVEEIRLSGGGSRNAEWRQIKSDVFGQRVYNLNAEQGPAYGVALLAATAMGAFASVEEACHATVRTTDATVIDLAASAYYLRAFPVWQSLYYCLKDEFQRIEKLEGRTGMDLRILNAATRGITSQDP